MNSISQKPKDNMKSLLKTAALVVGLALTACNAAPHEQLGDVPLKPGTTLANTHSVDVNVSALASSLHGVPAGELSLATANGRVFYKGIVSPTRAAQVHVALPVEQTELVATLLGGHGQKTTVRVPVTGTSVVYSFQ